MPTLTPHDKYARRQERRNALHAKQAAAAQARNGSRVDGPHSIFCLRGEATDRQVQLAKSIEELSDRFVKDEVGSQTTVEQIQHHSTTRRTKKAKQPGEKSPADRFFAKQLFGVLVRGRSRRQEPDQQAPVSSGEESTS